MLFAIYEGNMEKLEKKMQRISRKCEKLRCPFSFEIKGETFREFTDEYENKFSLRYVVVEASGTAVVNGWEYVAKLEHETSGNIITKAPYAFDVEIPQKYYTSKPICDHCGTNRTRKSTYIIRNKETGDFKQIGKSCLEEYTNGLSAEAVATFLESYETLQATQYYSGSIISQKKYFPVKNVLLCACECIQKYGYIKRMLYDPDCKEKIECTAETMLNFFDGNLGDFNPYNDGNNENVENAVRWLNEKEDNNEYFHNLKVIVGKQYVTKKHFQILASMFATYQKDLQRKAQQEAAKQNGNESKFVGEIKQRLKINVASIVCVANYDSVYGLTKIFKILDNKGNVYIWKTSNFVDIDQKGIVLTGTVKEHKEYNGEKQTVLTRCRIG